MLHVYEIMALVNVPFCVCSLICVIVSFSGLPRRIVLRLVAYSVAVKKIKFVKMLQLPLILAITRKTYQGKIAEDKIFLTNIRMALSNTVFFLT